MPFSAILFIVSVLMVIGVISLTEAIIKIFIKGKNPPDTILVKITDDEKSLDLILREVLIKYPFSKVHIDSSPPNTDTEKLLEIIRRDYPNIEINPPR